MGAAEQKRELKLEADVLVIGGGPAGTWAALTAALNGADVKLVDKGYCGSSGATAPSGTGVWYVPPDPDQREEAMKSREALGGFLAERGWMQRVLDRTFANVNKLADWGYPFPLDDTGKSYRRSLQGPEYMKLMRRKVQTAGVHVFDHSPALELLLDEDGAVAGATGVRLQTNETWTIRAGAVVIATGGCAFLSKALGCNVLTGDGYLLAAEAGADFSGMEFSNAYSLAPAFASVTKSAFYTWATFYRQDGSVLEGAGSRRGRSVIAKTPNFFLPFDRAGIDPFTQKFPVTLRLEGTVRGTGGIHIIDETCATKVPGLYAAGDAATRELICGGFTGGGSHNAAWAMSSGYWAGEAAALHAHKLGPIALQRTVKRVSQSVRGSGKPAGSLLTGIGSASATSREIVTSVQEEVAPYDRNLFRSESKLQSSLQRLEKVWKEVKEGVAVRTTAIAAQDVLKAREAAAMTATVRWMYAAALERKETRGMHKREDFPALDSNQHYRLITSGLDDIRVSPEKIVSPGTPQLREESFV
jgi:succinate dehydrogenase/fumarate reductase flavoprotein subunit